MKDSIERFEGDYYFLSNFYTCPITYKGITYRNTEAAFQSAKNDDIDYKTRLKQATGREAKKAGRLIKLRPDWNAVRKQVMYEVVKAKFEQNPALKEKLLATDNLILIEGNTWHDNTWGICTCNNCVSKNYIDFNNLGQILMRIRKEFKEVENKNWDRW